MYKKVALERFTLLPFDTIIYSYFRFIILNNIFSTFYDQFWTVLEPTLKYLYMFLSSYQVEGRGFSILQCV